MKDRRKESMQGGEQDMKRIAERTVETQSDKADTGKVWRCSHFRHSVAQGVFAMLMVAALVISDALPVGPAGLPDAVEAADSYPRKGTLTFYKYTRCKTSEEVLQTGDVMFIYDRGDKYWFPAKVADINNDAKNWKVTCTDVDFRIDPSADQFITRTKWTDYRIGYHTGNNQYYIEDRSYPYYSVRQTKDGLFADTSQYSALEAPRGSGESWFRPKFVQGVPGKGRTDDYYLGKAAASDAWYERLDWDGWHSAYTEWQCYRISTYTYTCINSNYTIGENQVYVADSDLFLREDVKLTIPDGSVLCVKNGPFYVNGEIECYGTILVEDGGIIMPYDSTSGGSRIVMKEGGAMIIRSGGRVYAGCPKGSLKTQGTSGWLDMYAGSSIINFGLLIAGQCNFKYGQATIENHKGGAMFLGYTVDNKDENYFINSGRVDDDLFDKNSIVILHSYFGVGKTNGTVHYGSGSNQTVLKIWDGAYTCLANKSSDGGETIKKYYYDKDGKCTVDSSYKP